MSTEIIWNYSKRWVNYIVSTKDVHYSYDYISLYNDDDEICLIVYDKKSEKLFYSRSFIDEFLMTFPLSYREFEYILIDCFSDKFNIMVSDAYREDIST